MIEKKGEGEENYGRVFELNYATRQVLLSKSVI